MTYIKMVFNLDVFSQICKYVCLFVILLLKWLIVSNLKSKHLLNKFSLITALFKYWITSVVPTTLLVRFFDHV